MENSFSTFEAAKYCDTTMTSVARWIKAGKLNAFTTPGGHRRILKQDLFEFMEKHKLPVPEELVPVKKKILIVDDDAELRENLLLFLTGDRYNFEADVAKDGYEAGMKVLQFEPDVIILDLKMPHMDGFGVCKRIKSDPSTQNIKVLVLTAYDDPANRKKANACGADKMLSKPVGTEELLKEINELLQQ